MRILRILGIVLVAAVVAAAVSTLVVLNHRDAGPGTPGPVSPSGPDGGSLAAVQRAEPSVVRVERGPASAVQASPSAAAAASGGGVVPPTPSPGGTGVVIDGRGYILTAEAVVAGASTISAAIPGGRTVLATVVASDPQDALTLLKVDSAGLHPISTIAAPQLVNGSGVVVLAAPPYRQVAVGAVAGIHASVSIADPSDPSRRRPLNDLLALDVVPREGQLGAPVLDAAGRLAGVVVAGGTQAYAVDMTQAQPLVQQMIDLGHLTYPSLGFEYQQLSVTEAADRGVAGGVLVASVERAAREAGLVVGDLVLSADGTTLDPSHPLAHILRGAAVRQQVALAVSGPDGPRKITLAVRLVSP